jgi:hypothetical protein
MRLPPDLRGRFPRLAYREPPDDDEFEEDEDEEEDDGYEEPPPDEDARAPSPPPVSPARCSPASRSAPTSPFRP